jgi:hypothetical protein
MKRRNVLLLGLGALCGVSAWRFSKSSSESAIVKILHKRLDYLHLDAAGVQRFARDLSARHEVSPLQLRAVDSMSAVYSNMKLSADNRLQRLVGWGEDRIVTSYLVSSDFFRNGADMTRTVNYLGLYDPFIPCGNPFARAMIGPNPSYPVAST